MQQDLLEERRVAGRRWAKREKQIARAIGGTATLYGELQGILGPVLVDIPLLSCGTDEDRGGGTPLLEAKKAAVSISPTADPEEDATA